VLLQRGRGSTPLPAVRARAAGRTLALEFAEGWLETHPLTRVDLDQEARYLQAAGYVLSLDSSLYAPSLPSSSMSAS
jgi:exopolyphosphatase / guanosine-5'-triphosphate,3'-diphosphate pyrophosphatase